MQGTEPDPLKFYMSETFGKEGPSKQGLCGGSMFSPIKIQHMTQKNRGGYGFWVEGLRALRKKLGEPGNRLQPGK